ncbi:MAG: peptidase, partial [Sphaerospermopsis kisseleviana]
AQTWVNQVSQAIKEWNNFLPLELVENSEIADIKADIKIMRQRPPLQINPISKIPRARSALATYELYNQNNFLLHRFTILLSSTQTGEHLQAAARHEMGHALGIWGHSP